MDTDVECWTLDDGDGAGFEFRLVVCFVHLLLLIMKCSYHKKRLTAGDSTEAYSSSMEAIRRVFVFPVLNSDCLYYFMLC